MRKTSQVTVAGLIAAASLLISPLSASASGEAGSISATNPQHFISSTATLPETNQDYTYSIKVNTPLSTDNIYYGQYNYAQGDGGYYSGVQPHANGTINVRFSFFGTGATAMHSNCDSGADGGSGVTCALDGLDYSVRTTYTINSHRTSDSNGTTYTGTITNETTGVKKTIGAWRLPADYPGFGDQMTEFIEKFSGISTCADIPAVSVDYTNFGVNGTAVSFSPVNKKAGYKPGSDGIYRCADVSSYQLTSSGTGSYSVRSTVGS